MGSSSGNNYIGAESNNVIIGDLNTGTLGDSNTIRIETPTTSQAFIFGNYNSA